MGLDFKAKLVLSINNIQAGDLNDAADEFIYEKEYSLAPGVGANQADKLYHEQRTLGATTAEDIDLSGVLEDVFGVAFTLVKLKGIFITKVSGTGPIQVLGQGTNGIVGPGLVDTDTNSFGDLFAMLDRSLAGWGITGGTADLLQVENMGGDSVVYDLFLVGTGS